MLPPETTGAALPEAPACPTANPPTSDPAAAHAAAQRTNPILIVPSLAYEAQDVRPPVPIMTSVVCHPELTQVSTNKRSGVGQDERSLKVRQSPMSIADADSFVTRRRYDVLHRCL